MKHKVYIAKLKRIDIEPYVIMKIGITHFQDALTRLNWNKNDKSSIAYYFPEIKVMKSRWVESKDKALCLESYIKNEIKKNDKTFHNWYETNYMSGITECRIWNYDEFLETCNLIDAYK